tara:strand:+ start:470 stop:967 length:498 start_codon:yes stop_codon:yes gene_type:complete
MCYFTGYEVEKTPAYGKKTLFVEGVQNTEEIITFYNKEHCEHLFFGANHSFNPGAKFPEDADEWIKWEDMISQFLKEGYLCSLDIPINLAEQFLETGLVDYDNFIPQLRVPVPYVKQWGYNTMLKIDDKDFKASNPGVWCHRLHNLLDEEKFTDWTKYGLDKPLV